MRDGVFQQRNDGKQEVREGRGGSCDCNRGDHGVGNANENDSERPITRGIKISRMLSEKLGET